ncbi:MAG: BatA and WFA domain-containing protein [Candidatus Kryptonium sp.]|nr:BatA and WFA domain-containing protein [Candidatus Kryptonium sp.]MCX7761792.1 BatA and WFA domain-containing protein [Candidatus Kryptonium sp.]MDW8109789.1 BatA and WFA domain-containing protein [Candidatus Kryptonium sp.]
MTFLNPAFLFALVASAIPVLIHLFNLRRLRTVEFSSVKFLKELQRSRIRSLKIKQIILLIIRVLAIVFLVLAFSRPVIKGYLFKPIIAGQARSSVILIIDNTLSMASTDENGSFINQAKSVAQGIADVLSESDEFALIRMSDLPIVATDGFIHNVSFFRKLIEETEFTYTHKKLYEALAVASELIEKAKNLNREIYIISDLQKSEFEFSLDTLNRKIKIPPDVRVFLVNVGEFGGQNFSVDKIEIKNKIIFPGRTLGLDAIVSNHGQSDVSNYVASVFLNGRRVAQKSVNIKSGESRLIDFNILTEDLSGFVEGFVEIEDDNFSFDNRRFFTFFIPTGIKLLLVGNDEDLRFLKLALSTVQEIYRREFFKITQASFQSLGRFEFSNFDVVFLVKPTQIDRSVSDRLRNFVSDGGGVVIFMGGFANFQNLNQNFNSVFKLPEFEGIVKQKMFFSKVDLNHPIFENVFTEAPKKFDSPEVREYVKFKTNYGFTSIVEFSDGSPFLIEKSEGSGRILIFTTEPTDRVSDLPYKGIFVPLVFQSVLYLTTPTGLKPEYAIGDTAEFRVDLIKKFYGQSFKDLKLVRPDGSDFAFGSNGNFVRIGQATIPGIYAISSGGRGDILKFAFNPPAEEFEYEKENEKEITSFLETFGVKQYKTLGYSERKIKDEILRARYGIELWKFFLALSILMFLAESLISRKM